ncbi:hypothetical protein FQR65_LT04086 [Abscondita terminalis]|nr:hypothetical protein FQR65_LT04086 [Abscondita terminalis]
MNIRKILKIANILISVCYFIRFGNGQKIEFAEWDGEKNSETNKDLISVVPKSLCGLSNALEGCEDERDAFLYRIIFNKRKEHDSGLNKAFSTKKITKSSRIPHTKSFNMCSCVMEPRVHNLGMMYFPRQIPTATCHPGGCFGGPYQCRPKKYKIQVLKRKQIDDLDREDPNSGTLLPHNLGESFISETFEATVACECLP